MTEIHNQGGATGRGEDLIDAAGAVGASVARLGIAAVSWPVYLLPPRARSEAIDATSELFRAVGRLHLGIARAAIRGLDLAAREINRVVYEQLEATEPATRPVTKVEKVRIETEN
ncbi:MAG: hypothetical protein RMK84_12115 [Oscillochloridaceae bacterium]|nr:hypothetical protein [Chloroflexaceae bacterium]MDW8390863.1 hypothetical protein [Oscillochloridaceae bacterium]